MPKTKKTFTAYINGEEIELTRTHMIADDRFRLTREQVTACDRHFRRGRGNAYIIGQYWSTPHDALWDGKRKWREISYPGWALHKRFDFFMVGCVKFSKNDWKIVQEWLNSSTGEAQCKTKRSNSKRVRSAANS